MTNDPMIRCAACGRRKRLNGQCCSARYAFISKVYINGMAQSFGNYRRPLTEEAKELITKALQK